MLQDHGRLGGGQVHGLGDQQPLALQRAGAEPRPQLLEEDALVQGVLVDEQHLVGRHLDHQVAAQHLHRPGHVGLP